MGWHFNYCNQGGECIVEARAIRGPQASFQDAHLDNRAVANEGALLGHQLARDSSSSRTAAQTYVEQVGQGSFSSNALTLSVVIGGAPLAVTRTEGQTCLA